MFANTDYGRFSVARLGVSLEISRVEKEDEGVYTCVALSQIGNSHAKAQLTVIGKDIIDGYLLTVLFNIFGCNA